VSGFHADLKRDFTFTVYDKRLWPECIIMTVKNVVRHEYSVVRKGLSAAFLPTLLLVGCAQSPDIRLGHDSYSGTTLKHDVEFFDCIKADVHKGEETFVVKDNETSMLFVGKPDPVQASGLVELSGSPGDRSYSVYQRHAWYDHGRLIKAAVLCAKV